MKQPSYIYALDYIQNDIKVKSKNEEKWKKALMDSPILMLLSHNKRLL